MPAFLEADVVVLRHAVEADDQMSIGDQPPGDMEADEAGAARDENPQSITPAFLWTPFAAAVSGVPDRAEMPASTAAASRNRQVRRGCGSARSGQEVLEV